VSAATSAATQDVSTSGLEFRPMIQEEKRREKGSNNNSYHLRKRGHSLQKDPPHTYTDLSHTTQPTTILRTNSEQIAISPPPDQATKPISTFNEIRSISSSPHNPPPLSLSHTYHNFPSPRSPKPSPPTRQKRPGARLAKRGKSSIRPHTRLPPVPSAVSATSQMCTRNVGPSFRSCSVHVFLNHTRQSFPGSGFSFLEDV